jgi:hypothetical protein
VYRWNFRKALEVNTTGWSCNQSGCVAVEMSGYSTNCDCFGLLSSELVVEDPRGINFSYKGLSNGGSNTLFNVTVMCGETEEINAQNSVFFYLYIYIYISL